LDLLPKSELFHRRSKLKSPLIICLTLLTLFGGACATYQSKVADSRSLLASGRFEEALAQLKTLAETESKDQLVYLLDYATALKIAGRHSEAQKEFIRADKLTEQLDYVSVSQVAAATLTSEDQLSYKGESYEKLLINAMNALSFVAEGKGEAALIEARRINEKVMKIRSNGREDYEPNPFAHYLAALLWESEKNYDSAYIEFERAYKADPSIPGLHADLIRMSKLARRNETYKKWKDQFPGEKENPEWYQKGYADLVVIVEQGWGPRKDFSNSDYRFPMLVPVYSETQSTRVEVTGRTQATTQAVYNVTQAAMETYQKDVAWMIARKIGSTIAKDLLAERIRQENQALGLVAWVVMRASDRADLRHWSTLPQSIQVARFRLTSGEYDLVLQGLNSGGGPTADRLDLRNVHLKSGQMRFISWRTLR